MGRESSLKLAKTWPPLRRITKRLAWTPTRLKTQPMTVNIRSRSWFETTTCCQKTTLKTGFLSFFVFYPYYPHYDKCVKPKNKIRSYSALQKKKKKTFFPPPKKKKKKKKKKKS